MIAIRADDVDWGDAPPEFVRGNILNAHPNWADCLKPLFEALEESNVPKRPGPDADYRAVLRFTRGLSS